jgi:hypothetical protein
MCNKLFFRVTLSIFDIIFELVEEISQRLMVKQQEVDELRKTNPKPSGKAKTHEYFQKYCDEEFEMRVNQLKLFHVRKWYVIEVDPNMEHKPWHLTWTVEALLSVNHFELSNKSKEAIAGTAEQFALSGDYYTRYKKEVEEVKSILDSKYRAMYLHEVDQHELDIENYEKAQERVKHLATEYEQLSVLAQIVNSFTTATSVITEKIKECGEILPRHCHEVTTNSKLTYSWRW